jgi:ferric enterobactin receptor
MCLCLWAQTLFSQQVDLKGMVADAQTSEDIPFATVALYKSGSDSLLDGTTTDWNGRFMLKNVNPGDYKVVASFIGFTNIEIPIEVKPGDKELDLGLLKINQAVINLETIEITSMARSIVNRLDRVSYRAADF